MLAVLAWQATYVGLMPHDYLDGLDVDQRAEFWRRILTGPGDNPQEVTRWSDRSPSASRLK